jgi:hypothetical protein
VWHCGDDQCEWSKEPSLNTSQWIVNRGDGKPTANLVILSFVDPVALLNKATNTKTLNGVPRGFTQNVINFFKSKGISVMFSIGGAAYISLWDQALRDPTTLAKNAAEVAKQFGVGIEIDYENENAASLNALDSFVKTYRTIIPYNSGMLTVDLGAGTGYLTSVSMHAAGWLNSSGCNWANAMVGAAPYSTISEGTMYWQQHLDGTKWNNLAPIPPNQLVVSLYASHGARDCASYPGSVDEGAVNWAKQKGVRGISFWSAGCPAPNDCVNTCPGLQQGSRAFLG